MKTVTIICTRTEGIYRAGVFHPAGKKDWPADSFSDEQMASIRKEPLLLVQDGDLSAGEASTADEAMDAAMAILEPFLRVSGAEARLALSELVHGGPAALPPVEDPILDRPLEGEAEKPKRAARRAARSEA